jgi:hypothetical protein
VFDLEQRQVGFAPSWCGFTPPDDAIRVVPAVTVAPTWIATIAVIAGGSIVGAVVLYRKYWHQRRSDTSRIKVWPRS